METETNAGEGHDRSSSPTRKGTNMNEETETTCISDTLIHLNENMGQMASLLESLCTWMPKLDDERPAGGKRRHPTASRASSSSAMYASDDNGGVRKTSFKRRREEDELSVHASDNDSLSDIKLLTEHQSEVNDHGLDEPNQKLLKELAESLDQNEVMGPPVQDQLAAIANKRWGKHLDPEKIKSLTELYKRPENCPDIGPIKVNNEIWTQLTPSKRKADLKLSNIQQTVRKVAVTILQTADELLPKTKEEVNKNLATRSVDAIAMLGHISHELSRTRREQIRPTLKSEYASICTADITNRPLLFGPDLTKQLKEAKDTNVISQSLTNNSKKNYNIPRGRGKQYDNKRYNYPSSNQYNKYNKGPRKDFLWKGQNKFYKRKKAPTEPESR